MLLATCAAVTESNVKCSLDTFRQNASGHGRVLRTTAPRGQGGKGHVGEFPRGRDQAFARQQPRGEDKSNGQMLRAQEVFSILLQGFPLIVTLLGPAQSVTITNCHNKR